MRYNVTEEGREGVYLVEKEVIINLVKDKVKGDIHNFIQSNFLIGADWTRSQFMKFIRSDKITKIAITIPAQMGHHIAVIADKLYLFDCGPITIDDLIVITVE